MAQLIRIADNRNGERHTVVFVHGLGGHPYETWRRRPDDNSFWPLWLAEDVPNLTVLSYGYTSPATNWVGTAMPLLDEAAHAFQVFLANDDLRHGEISFVCHSLGGLIVKQVLRIANERRDNAAIGDFLERVRQVVFIATPHTGSGKARLLDRLAFLAWPSHAARDLVANSPELRHLNFSYRELAGRQRDHLSHLVYYETSDTAFGRIVDEGAADPGLPSCTPTPIRADHVIIAKPRSRDELLYGQTRKFIADLLPRDRAVEALVVHPELPFKADRSGWEFIPKLVRLTAFGVIFLGAWIGVPYVTRVFHALDELPKMQEDVRETKRLTRLIVERQAASLPASASRQDTKVALNEARKSLEPAISELARRNDIRSRQAIEALENSDTSQAEALFRKTAEDEEKAGNKTAASQALRHLAAFYRLTNVAQATDLYWKAAQLDPDDYANWLDVGRMAMSAGQYAKAETAFGYAVELAGKHAEADPNDLNWKREQYASRTELGNSYRLQGKWEDAAKVYEEAAKIAETLTQLAPNDAGFKRDLSVVLERKGHVLKAEGNNQAALDVYQKSLEMARSLASPGDASSQRDLAVALSEVGWMQGKLGKPDFAIENYREGIGKLAAVVKDHPEDPYYQNTLAIIYNGAGTLLTNQGRLAEADRYFQEAVKIAKPLADSDKSNVEFLRSLIDIQWNYGDCLRKQRRMDDALEHYSAGAATAQHLIAGRMVNSTFQENAAVTYYEIGEIWRCQGNAKTALEYFTASAQILQSPAVAQSATAGRNLELSRNRIAQINARQPVSCAEYHLPFTRSR